MKTFNSTLQIVEFIWNSIGKKLNYHLSQFLLSILFLFCISYAVAGESKVVKATNAKNSNHAAIGRATLSPFSGSESLRATLYLLNANNTTILADGVFAEYNTLYHDSVLLEDAFKFNNINENLGIVRYGAVLSVERRPVIAKNDTLFFKLWKTTKRNYQFEFVTTNLDHPGMLAFLLDSYTGTSQSLTLNGATKINFTVNADAASANYSRFKIVYQPNILQAPLPVTFTSAKAFELNSKVVVEWKVENEINVEKYIVERSANGGDFTAVNSIAVLKLNNAYNSYSWVDNVAITGTSFYRIRSVDRDGAKKYSVILKVINGKISNNSITIYPNPIQGNIINLQFNNQSTGIYQLRLINNNGQVMYSGHLQISSSNMSQTIVTGKQLPYGIYQLEIKAPGNVVYLKKAFVQ
jgi:hypothetical protein